MNDATPPPKPDVPEESAVERVEEAVAKAEVVLRQVNWHRVRVYTISILLMCAMWFCGIMLKIRFQPISIINRALAELPYPSSARGAYWVNRRTLQVDNLKIGAFFYASGVTVTASPYGLWSHHLAKVEVSGAQLYAKELTAALESHAPAGPQPWTPYPYLNRVAGFLMGYSSDSLDWVIGRLEISRGTIMLDNLIDNTVIPVRIGVRHPLVLTALRLGKPDASPEMTQERTSEITAVSISSPFDPLAPVLSFPLTRVTFTYSEIWRHHIRRIDMIRPTMFLGEDLFWLTDRLKSTSPKPAHGVDAPWYVGELKVDFGRLAVSAFGQPVVHFPFFVETKVKDIRLDQLNQISVKSSVNIANLTQDYPEYKIRIKNLRGKIYFSWPPSDVKANNVVNSIQIDEISWNDIAAKKVSTSVTFDPEGIYGQLNGACEGGDFSGKFNYYYSKGFAWNADLFAKKINCQPIAEKLVSKYCSLTGELDGQISVQGRATEILKCTGQLALPNSGMLTIKSMEDLLQELPSSAGALQRQALQLAIHSFDTYPYTTGRLTLNYTPQGGASELHLDGPRGARDFQVVLHPYTGSAPPPKETQ